MRKKNPQWLPLSFLTISIRSQPVTESSSRESEPAGEGTIGLSTLNLPDLTRAPIRFHRLLGCEFTNRKLIELWIFSLGWKWSQQYKSQLSLYSLLSKSSKSRRKLDPEINKKIVFNLIPALSLLSNPSLFSSPASSAPTTPHSTRNLSPRPTQLYKHTESSSGRNNCASFTTKNRSPLESFLKPASMKHTHTLLPPRIHARESKPRTTCTKPQPLTRIATRSLYLESLGTVCMT